MPEYIVMPALSPDMTEGRVARWCKAEGDAIRAGEVIAEIETDKATVEYQSPSAGVLAKVLVAAGGDPVRVDTPIALLATQPAAGGRRIFATPIARRLARESDLDLASIRGTGPNGRIVRDDVLAARPPTSVETAPRVGAPGPVAAPSPEPAASQPSPVRAGTTPIPHSTMRRVIARRLLEAKQTIPHYYLTLDVDLDAALDLRRRFNERPAASCALTINDFVVKAVAMALRKVPAANATWTEDAVLRFEGVDVAVAVATDSGLVTPVIRDADRKTLTALSQELRDLATRARAGKLLPEAYRGGGCTISNLGMHGIREFAAIINPPQSCIVAVGAAEARAVVRDGAVVARTMMTCTLSADHRLLDGAVGAEFLTAVRAQLEEPLGLFALA